MVKCINIWYIYTKIILHIKQRYPTLLRHYTLFETSATFVHHHHRIRGYLMILECIVYTICTYMISHMSKHFVYILATVKTTAIELQSLLLSQGNLLISSSCDRRTIAVRHSQPTPLSTTARNTACCCWTTMLRAAKAEGRQPSIALQVAIYRILFWCLGWGENNRSISEILTPPPPQINAKCR